MSMVAVTTKTVDGAATRALIGLQTISDKLEYEVVDKRSTEFLGIGSKPAIIRARKKEIIEDRAMDFLPQIFEAMNMQVSITAIYNEEEQGLPLNPEGDGMGILVDKRGRTLDSLQYLISLIVNKRTEGYLRVKLDTENYHERRKGTLETLAKNIAYKVGRTRQPVSLEPTSPYGRRIIHVTLQNDKYATIRSEGEEPFRHVIIALKKETSSGNRRGRHDKSKGGRYDRDRLDRSGGCRGNNNRRSHYSSNDSSETSDETAVSDEM